MLFLNGCFGLRPKFNLRKCSFNNKHISYEFQEAAFDADKIFLAAIDKFDAMMSKSNVYAPDGMITCLLFILVITTHVLMIMDIRRQITISSKEARAEENPSLFNLQKFSISYLYLPNKEYSTFPHFLSARLEQSISPS